MILLNITTPQLPSVDFCSVVDIDIDVDVNVNVGLDADVDDYGGCLIDDGIIVNAEKQSRTDRVLPPSLFLLLTFLALSSMQLYYI